MLCARCTDDIRGHDERYQKIQIDMQHFLESLAVCLTSADGYVQSTESGVKDAVKRLVNELANKSTVNQRCPPNCAVSGSLKIIFVKCLAER